jgi:lipoprotein-releasing system ATP-binding protein
MRIIYGALESVQLSSNPTLQLQKISKAFLQGDQTISVLHSACLTICPGEMVGLLGSSGSGKTTLLQIAGLLEMPSTGKIFIDGMPCHDLTVEQKNRVRRDHLGFVYQFHHLLDELTALENVAIPLWIQGASKHGALKKAENMLEHIQLGKRMHHYPKQLSGGEQQRVSIARALVKCPMLLMGDEPTGNLDHQTASRVFDELKILIRSSKASALIATHDRQLAQRMDRQIYLEDGVLCEHTASV